jgi:hypothetical protein
MPIEGKDYQVMNTIEPDDRGLVLACPQYGQRNRLIYERLGQRFRCGKCRTELRPTAEPIEVKNEAVYDALAGRSSLQPAWRQATDDRLREIAVRLHGWGWKFVPSLRHGRSGLGGSFPNSGGLEEQPANRLSELCVG